MRSLVLSEPTTNVKFPLLPSHHVTSSRLIPRFQNEITGVPEKKKKLGCLGTRAPLAACLVGRISAIISLHMLTIRAMVLRTAWWTLSTEKSNPLHSAETNDPQKQTHHGHKQYKQSLLSGSSIWRYLMHIPTWNGAFSNQRQLNHLRPLRAVSQKYHF